MKAYMVVTFVASLLIILDVIVTLLYIVVKLIKKAVIALMEKKYGCEEIGEFEELETANEAYNRLFAQYEDLFDENNHNIAELVTLERKYRRLQNTCNDLLVENARLKGEREQDDVNDPKVCGYGHIEKFEE